MPPSQVMREVGGWERLGRAVTVAAIIGAAVLAFGAPPAAVADENALILPGGAATVTLGPNAVLRIDGRLRYFRNCEGTGTNDFVYPATDIYIVESGFDPTTGPINQKLVDVTGMPNTVIQPGTAFIEQILAITAPSGNLRPGTYSIVYDTCQDGVFQRTKGDEIYPNVLTVAFPPEIPPVDTALLALKNDAYTDWGRWKEIGRLFDSLLAVNSIAGCGFGAVSDCLSVLKIWVDSPTIQKWIETYGSVKTAAECAGGEPGACFGILADYWGFDSSPIRSAVLGGAKAMIANQAKSFFGVYADPPRSDFDQPTSVKLTFPVPTVRGESPIIDSMSSFASALEREQLLWEALLAAVERYQGAQGAGRPDEALAQLRSAIGIAAVLDDAGAATADLLDAALDSIDTDFADLDTVATRRFSAISRYRLSGLDVIEDQSLRNAGVGGPDRLRLLDDTVEAQGQLNPTEPMRNLRLIVDSLVADQTDRAATLDALRADLAAISSSITGTSGVPTIAIPALTSAGSGTPVTLTSTTTNATTVLWDLDADGDFDDGTGPTIQATFAAAGYRVIAARAVNDAGISVTAHGLVDVVSSNAPPTISSTTPGDAVTGTVGQTTTFSVVASDPTGETLRYQWFLDDEPIDGATGPTVDIVPTSAQRGARTVSVYVHDPRPGNMDQHAWRWSVTDPDRDGDGWADNVYADCDDSNGDVHPRRPEVLFNGVDDDCDPSTADRPLELSVGQLWGWGTSDGSNGTGTGLGSATPRFTGRDRVAQVVASFIAGAYIDDRGAAWAWGSGAMPGDGVVSGTARPLPTPVLGIGGSGQLSGVTQLSSSFYSFLARLSDGRVVTWGGQWGSGAQGSLGQGNSQAVQPFAPTPGYVVDASLEPITGVAAVEGGYTAGYAILTDGTAMQWGTRICTPGLARFDWAVPAPHLGTDIVQIEAGNASLFIRRADGTVAWCNDTGLPPRQLSLADFGGAKAVDMATIGNGQGGFVLTDDGTVWVIGAAGAPAVQAAGLTTEAPINGTTFVKVVLPAGAKVVALDGQDVPCAIFAVRSDGTALSWGDTNRSCDGQGPGRTVVNGAATPGPLDIPGNVLDVSGGGYSSLALVQREGADVWSWGQDFGAGRGGDLSRPGPIPGLTNVVEVQTWFRHGYALRTDGRVIGWGLNDSNAGGFDTQLGPIRGVSGVGVLTDVVDITEGHPTMFALRSDGRVVSWGYDSSYGSLGSGTDVFARSYPDFVLGADLQPLTGVQRIFSIGNGGMAQLADGSLVQWGLRQCTGVDPLSALSRVALPAPGLPRNVVQATSSTNNGTAAIFRLADGSVVSCGDNRPAWFSFPADDLPHPFGDFGPENPAVDVDTRGLEWWVVTADGRVWVKTFDTSGLVLNISGGTAGVLHEFPVPDGAPIVDVEADSGEIHLRRADGTLLTFGANTFGATGRPSNTSTPGVAEIDGFVIGSSADGWNGLALVIPESLIGGDGWTPPDPSITVSAGDGAGPEGGTATVPVTLDRAAAQDITVGWAFGDQTGSAIIATGGTTVDVQVDLPAPDGVWGVDRSAVFELTSATAGATLLDELGDVTITDVDSPPTMTITPPSIAEGDETPSSATATVTLSKPAGRPVDITLRSTDGTATAGVDFTEVDLDTTIEAGSTSVTLPLVLAGNVVPQPDRVFTLSASSSLLSTVSQQVTIVDDDPLALIASASRVAAGDTATVRLRVPDLPAGESVTVQWSSVDGSATAPTDYEAGSATITIDGAGEATIQVRTNPPPALRVEALEADPQPLESLSFTIALESSSATREVLAPRSVVVGIDRVLSEPPPPTTVTTTTTVPPSPTTTAPTGTVAPPPPTLTTPTTVFVPVGELPVTGGDSNVVVRWAVLVIGSGLCFLLGARLRRRTRA